MRRFATLLVVLAATPIQAAVHLDAQLRDVAFSALATHQELFCLTPQDCTPISQTLTPDADSAAAGDFGPFSAALSSALFPSIAVAQSSTLSASRLEAHASHAATGAASLGSGGSPGVIVLDYTEHDTSSHFRVDFSVDEPTAYVLDGAIAAAGAGFIGQNTVHVELRRSTGEVLHRIALQDDDDCFDPECLDLGTMFLDESGTLAADSYVLEAELSGQTEVFITTQVQAANDVAGSFDVDLRLGPQVPVPPVFAPLLVIAFGGLAWRPLRDARCATDRRSLAR